MILTKKAIESISEKLFLPVTGDEQDWEIELANSERVVEFVFFYQEHDLCPEEKKALMSLIFASYDDYLNINDIERDELWEEISRLVQLDKRLFSELIDYWRLNKETSPENYFHITHLIRKSPFLSIT